MASKASAGMMAASLSSRYVTPHRTFSNVVSCNVCGHNIDTTSAENLRKHLSIHAIALDPPPKDSQPNKHLPADVWNHFTSETDPHDGKVAAVCNICGKTFKVLSEDSLRYHLKLHSIYAGGASKRKAEAKPPPEKDSNKTVEPRSNKYEKKQSTLSELIDFSKKSSSVTFAENEQNKCASATSEDNIVKPKKSPNRTSLVYSQSNDRDKMGTKDQNEVIIKTEPSFNKACSRQPIVVNEATRHWMDTPEGPLYVRVLAPDYVAENGWSISRLKKCWPKTKRVVVYNEKQSGLKAGVWWASGPSDPQQKFVFVPKGSKMERSEEALLQRLLDYLRNNRPPVIYQTQNGKVCAQVLDGGKGSPHPEAVIHNEEINKKTVTKQLPEKDGREGIEPRYNKPEKKQKTLSELTDCSQSSSSPVTLKESTLKDRASALNENKNVKPKSLFMEGQVTQDHNTVGTEDLEVIINFDKTSIRRPTIVEGEASNKRSNNLSMVDVWDHFNSDTNEKGEPVAVCTLCSKPFRWKDDGLPMEALGAHLQTHSNSSESDKQREAASASAVHKSASEENLKASTTKVGNPDDANSLRKPNSMSLSDRTKSLFAQVSVFHNKRKGEINGNQPGIPAKRPKLTSTAPVPEVSAGVDVVTIDEITVKEEPIKCREFSIVLTDVSKERSDFVSNIHINEASFVDKDEALLSAKDEEIKRLTAKVEKQKVMLKNVLGKTEDTRSDSSHKLRSLVSIIQGQKKELTELKAKIAAESPSLLDEGQNVVRDDISRVPVNPKKVLCESQSFEARGGFRLIDLNNLRSALTRSMASCKHRSLTLVEHCHEEARHELATTLAFLCTECGPKVSFLSSPMTSQPPVDYVVNKKLAGMLGPKAFRDLAAFVQEGATEADYRTADFAGNRTKSEECGHCDASFTSLESLAIHISINHNVQKDPKVCSICFLAFESGQECSTHVALKHPETEAARSHRNVGTSSKSTGGEQACIKRSDSDVAKTVVKSEPHENHDSNSEKNIQTESSVVKEVVNQSGLVNIKAEPENAEDSNDSIVQPILQLNENELDPETEEPEEYAAISTNECTPEQDDISALVTDSIRSDEDLEVTFAPVNVRLKSAMISPAKTTVGPVEALSESGRASNKDNNDAALTQSRTTSEKLSVVLPEKLPTNKLQQQGKTKEPDDKNIPSSKVKPKPLFAKKIDANRKRLVESLEVESELETKKATDANRNFTADKIAVSELLPGEIPEITIENQQTSNSQQQESQKEPVVQNIIDYMVKPNRLSKKLYASRKTLDDGVSSESAKSGLESKQTNEAAMEFTSKMDRNQVLDPVTGELSEITSEIPSCDERIRETQKQSVDLNNPMPLFVKVYDEASAKGSINEPPQSSNDPIRANLLKIAETHSFTALKDVKTVEAPAKTGHGCNYGDNTTLNLEQSKQSEPLIEELPENVSETQSVIMEAPNVRVTSKLTTPKVLGMPKPLAHVTVTPKLLAPTAAISPKLLAPTAAITPVSNQKESATALIMPVANQKEFSNKPCPSSAEKPGNETNKTAASGEEQEATGHWMDTAEGRLYVRVLALDYVAKNGWNISRLHKCWPKTKHVVVYHEKQSGLKAGIWWASEPSDPHQKFVFVPKRPKMERNEVTLWQRLLDYLKDNPHPVIHQTQDGKVDEVNNSPPLAAELYQTQKEVVESQAVHKTQEFKAQNKEDKRAVVTYTELFEKMAIQTLPQSHQIRWPEKSTVLIETQRNFGLKPGIYTDHELKLKDKKFLLVTSQKSKSDLSRIEAAIVHELKKRAHLAERSNHPSWAPRPPDGGVVKPIPTKYRHFLDAHAGLKKTVENRRKAVQVTTDQVTLVPGVYADIPGGKYLVVTEPKARVIDPVVVQPPPIDSGSEPVILRHQSQQQEETAPDDLIKALASHPVIQDALNELAGVEGETPAVETPAVDLDATMQEGDIEPTFLLGDDTGETDFVVAASETEHDKSQDGAKELADDPLADPLAGEPMPEDSERAVAEDAVMLPPQNDKAQPVSVPLIRKRKLSGGEKTNSSNKRFIQSKMSSEKRQPPSEPTTEPPDDAAEAETKKTQEENEVRQKLLMEKEARFHRFTANKERRAKLSKLINLRLVGEARGKARHYMYKTLEEGDHTPESYKEVTTRILQMVTEAVAKSAGK